MSSTLESLKTKLLEDGYGRYEQKQTCVHFTQIDEANLLINDLENNPHAYVIGCIMDRQIKAERALEIPWHLKQRLGYFDFKKLSSTPPGKIKKAMFKPEALHRFNNDMTVNFVEAIAKIKRDYNGHAAYIWSDRPSSAAIVRRFLEFKGVGQKIATMATNILVRDFKINVSDKYSIDISVDVHIKRVLSRMGFIVDGDSHEYIVFKAREMNPDYPGVFDLILWELGREVCTSSDPKCDQCNYSSFCATYIG